MSSSSFINMAFSPFNLNSTVDSATPSAALAGSSADPNSTSSMTQSNTIIIANLFSPEFFQPSVLNSIRSLLHSISPLRAFSPIPSLRRILVAFIKPEAAVAIHEYLDNRTVLGNEIRVYFGEKTPIREGEEIQFEDGYIDSEGNFKLPYISTHCLAPTAYLQAPLNDKQFLISPPSSPPAGWTMQQEDPPNTCVHAEDLIAALRKLGCESEREVMHSTETGCVQEDQMSLSRDIYAGQMKDGVNVDKNCREGGYASPHLSFGEKLRYTTTIGEDGSQPPSARSESGYAGPMLHDYESGYTVGKGKAINPLAAAVPEAVPTTTIVYQPDPHCQTSFRIPTIYVEDLSGGLQHVHSPSIVRNSTGSYPTVSLGSRIPPTIRPPL